MSKPGRNSKEGSLRGIERTFFITSKTVEGRALLRSERNALLLIDTMRSYVKANRFVIHDFVVMPNHLHALITVDSLSSIEKAVGLIKGCFSYRVKKELGYQCGRPRLCRGLSALLERSDRMGVESNEAEEEQPLGRCAVTKY